MTYGYSTSSPTFTVGSGWTSFFQNNDATYCPVLSCTLKNAGCSTTYTGSDMSISGTTPWVITAVRNNLAGYITTVCVECTNGRQTITQDSLRVELRTCASTLSVSTSPLANSVIGFSTTATPVTHGAGWSSFFQNSDTTYCPVTGCSLKSDGCGN